MDGYLQRISVFDNSIQFIRIQDSRIIASYFFTQIHDNWFQKHLSTFTYLKKKLRNEFFHKKSWQPCWKLYV